MRNPTYGDDNYDNGENSHTVLTLREATGADEHHVNENAER